MKTSKNLFFVFFLAMSLYMPFSVYSQSGGFLDKAADIIGGAVGAGVAEAEKFSKRSGESAVKSYQEKGGCFAKDFLLKGDVYALNSLRKFRDRFLLKTEIGKSIVNIYYSKSKSWIQTFSNKPVATKIMKYFVKNFISVINLIYST